MSTKPTRLSIKVQPNAGRNEVIGLTNGVWKIKIAAPPEKGKANKELIEFLSDTLKLRKDRVTILKGETSHNKVVAIEDFTPAETSSALSAMCKKHA
jgi:uncharacterized protein